MAKPFSMSVEVRGLIAKSFSKEHVASVIEEACRILPAYEHRKDTLVVINDDKIAVILDKQACRGMVIPLEFIEENVSGAAKERLQTWLAFPIPPFYVLHIPGSWFSPETGEKDVGPRGPPPQSRLER